MSGVRRFAGGERPPEQLRPLYKRPQLPLDGAIRRFGTKEMHSNMATSPRQPNFRMDEVTSDLWDKVREEAGLKNDELFSRMLEVDSTSACVDSLSHAEEMCEVQETMGTAVAQMAGVLGKAEARSRPASERSRAELEGLRGRLAAASERADELAAKLQDDRESEGCMRDEARARVEDADMIAEHLALRDPTSNTSPEERARHRPPHTAGNAARPPDAPGRDGGPTWHSRARCSGPWASRTTRRTRSSRRTPRQWTR